MSTVSPLRVCIACKVPKPESEFYEKSGGNLFSWCKPCHYERTKAHRAANPGLNAKYAREAYRRDPASALVKARAWREKNPERQKEITHNSRAKRLDKIKAYRAANADRIKEWAAGYREKKAAEIKAYNFTYNRENASAIYERVKKCAAAKPEHYDQLHKAAKHRRSVRLISNGPTEKFTDLEIFNRDGWVCQLCGEKVDRSLKHPDPKSASLDHVHPIAKGGGHMRANSQLAHLVCNIKKKDRLLLLF